MKTQIAIRTKRDTTSWAFGRKIMEVLLDQGSKLLPELIASGTVDSFRKKIYFEELEACKDYWAKHYPYNPPINVVEHHDDFLWRRRKTVKTEGLFEHTLKNIKGQIVPGHLDMTSAWHKEVDWSALFSGWCEHMSPQIGMVHVLTKPEMFELPKYNLLECTDEEARFEGGWSDFRIGSFGSGLKPEIPNIGWAMFYGDEFAAEVHEASISSAGFPVQKIGDGYLVQVTEDINDVVNDFAMFSKRRAELKSLFRDGLFMIKDEPIIT